MYKKYWFVQIFLAICAVMVLCGTTWSQEADDIIVTTQRLSDRVLVLSETLMGNNVVAVNAEKGIVVIDDTGLPSTAAKMRRMIEATFKRDDFVYLINTHHHWDHSFGNQVFADAVIIGHENVPSGMARDMAIMPRRIASLEQRLKSETERFKSAEVNPEETPNVKVFLSSLNRQINDFKNGFVSTPPNITFTDKMVLDLGDMTVKLYYFGRAHSTSDIFIHIPEEKILMTGDLFLDQRWVPLFAGQPVLDIDQWLEVMHAVLDGEDAPEKVIPGHMDLWETGKLTLWRDYIKTLWEGVKKAKAAGLSLEETKEQLPLQKPYFYLRERGHSKNRILRFHDENIEAFWTQLFTSAAVVLEDVMRRQGIEEAVKKLHEMKGQPDTYLINESQLNSLGYKLMGEEKLDEALAIFKCNVALFPESFNVYDSLGEAYMHAGNKKLAVKNYKKSRELNPQNTNAAEMIKRMTENQ